MRAVGIPGVALAFMLVIAMSVQGGFTWWPGDGPGHNHRDGEQHADLGFNMEQISHVGFGDSIGELDIAVDPLTGKTWIAVALLSGGFALVDATDPESPEVVSTVHTPGYGADVKLSEDTNTVYLSLHPIGAPVVPECHVPHTGMVLPVTERLACGVQVYDVTIKQNPIFLASIPSSTFGTHMADYQVLNGVPILAMAAYGNPTTIQIGILGGGKIPIIVSQLNTGFMHDMTLLEDPLQPGRSLAVVANWDQGVRVYDITDPFNPFEAGHWPAPPGSGGRIHTVMMTEIDDRRIIIATQENFFQNVVSNAFFLDATDLDNIELISEWGNPDGHRTTSGFRWSTHNFNLNEGRMTMAHYHGGVLVFDVSSLDKLTDPPVLGNFIPNEHPSAETILLKKPCGLFHDEDPMGIYHPDAYGPDSHAETPFTWDAKEHNGVYWATDIYSGLYAIRLVE